MKHTTIIVNIWFQYYDKGLYMWHIKNNLKFFTIIFLLGNMIMCNLLIPFDNKELFLSKQFSPPFHILLLLLACVVVGCCGTPFKFCSKFLEYIFEMTLFQNGFHQADVCRHKNQVNWGGNHNISYASPKSFE